MKAKQIEKKKYLYLMLKEMLRSTIIITNNNEAYYLMEKAFSNVDEHNIVAYSYTYANQFVNITSLFTYFK